MSITANSSYECLTAISDVAKQSLGERMSELVGFLDFPLRSTSSAPEITYLRHKYRLADDFCGPQQPHCYLSFSKCTYEAI